MITQTLTRSFLLELFQGVHVLPTDQLRMALYRSVATLGPETTAYTADGEAVGTGYTARGLALQNVSIVGASTGAFVTFDNPSFAPGSYFADGALIFNASKADRAIAVLSFGGTKIADPTRSFVVTLPPAQISTALLRLQINS